MQGISESDDTTSQQTINNQRHSEIGMHNDFGHDLDF